MTTNLKAESPVWFDPQAMTNVLSFGNIVKQYPVQYLQESDTFQVQLSDCINLFGHKQVDHLYVLEVNLEKNLQYLLHPKKTFPEYKQHDMSKLLRRMPSFSLPRR